MKKHKRQSIHKIARIRYSKVSAKYKQACTAKYSQIIEKHVGQIIKKKSNINFNTKNGKIHFEAYFVTERQSVTKNEANELP
jgi:hypothetical protein